MSRPVLVEPRTLLLEPGPEVPNNPRLAVLHYPGVLAGLDADLAPVFEALFDANGWPPAWRDGILPFHHFHSTAHEVLGIYSGTVTVRLGGKDGVDVVLEPGDVVVLPAGVGHRKLGCRGMLGVVGAYPAGQEPDMCRPDPSRLAAHARTVAAVAMPAADPVWGHGGPLQTFWQAGAPGSAS